MSRPWRSVPWRGTAGITPTAWPGRGCDGYGRCAGRPWSACGHGSRAYDCDGGCWADTCASRRRSRVFEVARGIGSRTAGTPPEEGATGRDGATAVSRCAVVAEEYRCARCAGNRPSSRTPSAQERPVPLYRLHGRIPEVYGPRPATGAGLPPPRTWMIQAGPRRSFPTEVGQQPPRSRLLSTAVDDVVDEVFSRVSGLVDHPREFALQAVLTPRTGAR